MSDLYHYSSEFPISSTDTDGIYECKPSVLFEFLQRPITDQADHAGIGRDAVLSKYNCYWMVLRIWLKLSRPVIWGETLTVRVTVRKPVGTRIYRDCDLFIGEEHVGEATTIWLLCNRRTKKPMDLEHLPELPKENVPEAKDVTLSRIVFPENMELHDQRKLYYSDTDINGHISNIRYVDLACDAAELDKRPQGVFLQEIVMSYVGECYAGDLLNIYRGKQDGNIFIHGVGGDGTDRFDCTIRMSSTEGL